MYVISPDDEFTPKGKITHINYWKRFIKYGELAAKLERTSVGKETFRLWNEYVFNGAQDKHDPAVEDLEGVDELLDELDRLAEIEQEMGSLEPRDAMEVDEQAHDEEALKVVSAVQKDKAAQRVELPQDENDIEGDYGTRFSRHLQTPL
jgi:hypothetical protein